MSSVERPPRAVLDADVIFSRVLHELFGRLATELRLFTFAWSDELLDEAERVELGVGLPAGLAQLTVDPDDEHVGALAVLGKAALLVTRDRGYLKRALEVHGVAVVTPDEVLVRVVGEEPDAVVAVLRSQARVWGGGRSLDELLDALERAQAGIFVSRVRARLT